MGVLILYFSDEVALKAEASLKLSKEILNTTAPHTDEKDCSKSGTRYALTKQCLVKHMEEDGNMKFPEARVATDM